jgi:hypothetical protein
MINDRIELLEKEIEAVKTKAADMYYDIAVNNNYALIPQYNWLLEVILSRKADLTRSKMWRDNESNNTSK